MNDKEKRILKFMQEEKLTANQIIEKIFQYDVKKKNVKHGWKYYLQLNKLFAPMSRKNLIVHDGYYCNVELNKLEKLWQRAEGENE